MWKLLLIIVILIVIARPPGEAAAETRTIRTEGAIGCKQLASADKVQNLILAKDSLALYKFVLSRVLVDDCRTYIVGDVLTVEKRAFNDAMCMRAQGDPDCYWVNKGWMR